MVPTKVAYNKFIEVFFFLTKIDQPIVYEFNIVTSDPKMV